MDIPKEGPASGGLWWRIPGATAVFADIKRSTSISVNGSRKDAAYAYTYFLRAMAVIFDKFGARYIDIQGDGVFGLFSGKDATFSAAACAITMKTHMERVVEPRFRKDASTKQGLKIGIGVDQGTLLVRRLGLRNTGQNEVWAGSPVNAAAKLSSVAGDNQVVVSDRVFARYGNASRNKAEGTSVVLRMQCRKTEGRPGSSGGPDHPSLDQGCSAEETGFGLPKRPQSEDDVVREAWTGVLRSGGNRQKSCGLRFGRASQVTLRVPVAGDRVHQGGGRQGGSRSCAPGRLGWDPCGQDGGALGHHLGAALWRGDDCGGGAARPLREFAHWLDGFRGQCVHSQESQNRQVIDLFRGHCRHAA